MCEPDASQVVGGYWSETSMDIWWEKMQSVQERNVWMYKKVDRGTELFALPA